MQQRLATALTNALAVGNVNHLLGRHALGVLHQTAAQACRVRLVQVISLYAAPPVALDTLDNALGQIGVLDRQIVRLQQFQGIRHAMQVLIVRHDTHQLLGQRLAVAQPAAAHQALHLRPAQFAGRLGP
ncbi:hypothetical protein D3C78_1273580 [compost metagenome]